MIKFCLKFQCVGLSYLLLPANSLQFYFEPLRPALCSKGLVAEISEGFASWGLSGLSRNWYQSTIWYALGSWLRCCGGKMYGFGSCDAHMCTQQVTFEVGLLYSFWNLVEGMRSPPSFFRKDGIYSYIQCHPVLAQLQIISAFATLHTRTRNEPESSSAECYDSWVF